MKTYSTGAIPSPPDERDYRMAAAARVELPAKYLIKPPPAIDQGAVNNCVAQSNCYVSRSVYGVPFTPNWLYGRRADGDYQGPGWYIREALKTLLHEGNVPDDNYTALEVKDVLGWVATGEKELLEKAAPFTIDSFVRLTTAFEIKQALYNGMRVVFSTNITSFEPDEEGVFHCTERVYGCHAMSVWGWQENYFRVLNSWGSAWGEDGMCWMTAGDILRLNDVWGIADKPNELVVNPEGEEMRIKIKSAVSAGKKAKIYAQRDSKSAVVGYLRAVDEGVMLSKFGSWCEVTVAQTADLTVTGWIQSKYVEEVK